MATVRTATAACTSSAINMAASCSSMIEKEHKEQDNDGRHFDGDDDDDIVVRDNGGVCCSPSEVLSAAKKQQPVGGTAHNNNLNINKRLNLVQLLLGRCGMCTAFEGRGLFSSGNTQFVELQGLRFIGLGALADELSPIERVHDTLEQLKTRTERLISIGYLLDPPFEGGNDGAHGGGGGGASSPEKGERVVNESSSADNGAQPGTSSSPAASPATNFHYNRTETIPLDVWNNNNPEKDHSMSKQVQMIVELTTTKQFKQLQDEFTRQLRHQKTNPNRGNNKYLSGITAHNLGVLAVLRGKPEEAIAYFREAICLKEQAFGRDDREVALSWGELGIQFFARGDFEGALTSFREAHSARSMYKDDDPSGDGRHPSLAMVLNNMACCYFQMGDHRKALQTLQEADEIQQRAVSSSAQADLDLLHVAIVICNCGYLMLALKQYEEARSLLEEALLIQQSVLDDSHRAVRDTLSNIEFANAFHS